MAASAASPDKTYDPSNSLEKNKHATYWARWSDVSIAFARLRSMSICDTISCAGKKAGNPRMEKNLRQQSNALHVAG